MTKIYLVLYLNSLDFCAMPVMKFKRSIITFSVTLANFNVSIDHNNHNFPEILLKEEPKSRTLLHYILFSGPSYPPIKIPEIQYIDRLVSRICPIS